MLIVDGHYDHMILLFLDNMERYRIIVILLSLHSTYQLLPLDIWLFLPLNKTYLKELSDFMMKHQNFISISKKMFYLFLKGNRKYLLSKKILSLYGEQLIYSFII